MKKLNGQLIVSIVTAIIAIVVLLVIWNNPITFDEVPEYPSTAEHHELERGPVIVDGGKFYQICYYEIDNEDDGRVAIAFCSEDRAEMSKAIKYTTPGFYPECYYEGDYEILDMSEQYMDMRDYSLTSDRNIKITDISEIEEDEYYSYYDGRWRSIIGSEIVDECENVKEVKVYDFSSFLGDDHYNSDTVNKLMNGALRIGATFVIVVASLGIVIPCTIVGIKRLNRENAK